MVNYNEMAPKSKIFLFILLTFLFTWAVEIPAALSSHGLVGFRISKELQTIATLSPGVIALLLIAIFEGKKGLRLFLEKLIKFRVSYKWYAFLLLTGLLIGGISLLIFMFITKQNIKTESAYMFLFYLCIFFLFSPLWEELGWRGYLLPRMQERFTPITASLIIGIIWGLWHLPIYLGFNAYGDKTIIFFSLVFISCLPISIILTWVYNSTKGNILLCIFFHDGVNAGIAYSNADLPQNEFRTLEISLVLFICLAVAICIKTKGNLSYSQPKNKTNVILER